MRMQIAAVCATALALGGGIALAGTGQDAQEPSGEREPVAGSEARAEADVSETDIQETAGKDALSLESLSSEQKMALQRRLQQEGFYDGKIDGIVGPMTHAALQQFQDQEGIAGRGTFNQETADRLGIDTSEAQPVSGREQEGMEPTAAPKTEEKMPEGAKPVEPAQTPEPAETGEAAQQETAPSMAPGAPSAPESVKLSALDSEQVKGLQQKLQELGFYKGNVDGIIGPKTKAALSSYFQQRAQLASKGQITTEDAQAMGLSVSDVQPVRGEEKEAQPEPGEGKAPSEKPGAVPTGTTEPGAAPTGTTEPGAAPTGTAEPGAAPTAAPTGQIKQESESGSPTGQGQPPSEPAPEY